MNKVRIALYSVLGAICVFVLGHAVASTKLKTVPPFDMADRFSAEVAGLFAKPGTTVVPNRNYSSIFTSLKSQRVSIPKSGERSGTGGALATSGSDLVVMRFDGRIFLVDPDGEVSETNIATPDNGYAEYFKAGTEGNLADLSHNFGWFRYNDILVAAQADTSYLVVSYTYFRASEVCYGTRVATYELLQRQDLRGLTVSADDWTVLYESSPCLPVKRTSRAIEGHVAGGRIADDGTGRILLANGDYGNDGTYGPISVADGRPAVAQDPATDYGKVIAIDLATGAVETLSSGHRNPQGIAVRDDGSIWSVEHGARGGDELNLILPGRNYGWPYVSYGTEYSRLPISTLKLQGFHDGYQRPKLAFLPSLALSGLTVVRGFHETWDGDLLASGLASGLLIRFRIVDGNVIFGERIEIGERIRYVQQTATGKIALWLDSGDLLLLEADSGTYEWAFIERRIQALPISSDLKTRLRSAMLACAECHSFAANVHENAPSLTMVYDSSIASTEFAGYSGALQDRSGNWTREDLRRYLTDPDEYAPGTAMPNPQLDSEVVEPLLSILEQLRYPI